MAESGNAEEEVFAVKGVRGKCVRPEEEGSDLQDMWATYRGKAQLPQQTHSLNVSVVEPGVAAYPETDALISFRPDIAVGVVTADCVPILLYAEDVGGIAAVHAGWRGTLGGIVEKVVEVLKSKGSDPEKMHAFIGPSIHQENYEVDRELGETFIGAGFREYVSWPGGRGQKPHIDLAGINRARLERQGLIRAHIQMSEVCTFGYEGPEGERYPSYRRTQGTPLRLLTYIQFE